MTKVEAPCPTRNASVASPGTTRPSMVRTSGTRRTVWSRSGSQFSAPIPEAFSERTGSGTTALLKAGMNGTGSSPALATPCFAG